MSPGHFDNSGLRHRRRTLESTRMFILATLGRRIGAGLAVICTVLLAIAALAVWQMLAAQASLRDIAEGGNRRIALATDMMQSLSDVAVSVRNMALLSTNKELDAELAALEQAITRYETFERSFGELAASAPGDDAASTSAGELLARIEASRKTCVPAVREAARLGNDGATPEAVMVITGTVGPVMARWREQVAQLIQLESERGRAAYASARDGQRTALVVIAVSGTLGLLAAVALAVWLTRSVTVPVSRAAALAERIAQGDLTTEVAPAGQDEVGRLLGAMGGMQTHLAELVSAIQHAAQSIDTSACEIADGNLDLSRRTEQSAANLQRTASAMEEMTRTVAQSEAAARQAHDGAAAAARLARQGDDIAGQVTTMMDRIATSSRQVRDITTLIDTIAFQTNILALNAAVEAARAGQHGRGFAVVAEEVRTLAQRCAQAAREIRELVQSSAEQVEEGTLLVRSSRATMAEIVSSVSHVTAVTSHISTAAAEQSAGIADINQAINHLDHSTQQNAALVEEAAAAAGSLQQEARRLASLVGSFRLTGEPSDAPAAAPAADSGLDPAGDEPATTQPSM